MDVLADAPPHPISPPWPVSRSCWVRDGPAPIAAAGLDSPYPAVRSAASELARSINNPQLQRLANRSRGSREGPGTGLVPDEAPATKSLGTSTYPGSSYSFAASRQGIAVYRTRDDPEKVIAYFAKGRRVLSGAELGSLRKQKGGKKNDDAMAQAMIQAVMSGQDAQAAMKQMMESTHAQPLAGHRKAAKVDPAYLQALQELQMRVD